MTAGPPGEPAAGDGDVLSLLAEARTRARALVLDELVAVLAGRYRDELSGHLLAGPTAATGPEQPVAAHEPPAPVPAAPTAEPQQAWYAYCVLRGTDAAGRVAVADLPGIEARPVRLVDCGALTAVAAQVPLSGFQDLDQAPDLAEDGWLADSARGHEQVVEGVFRDATVLPFRFGVLYPDEDGLRAAIRTAESALLAELSRLDEAAEWGVRAYLDQVETVPPDDQHAPAALDGPDAGTAWMARRRAAAHASGAARDLAHRVAVDLHDTLSRHARESVVRPRPRRATATTPVLEAAYLLARDGDADLRAQVTKLSGRYAASGLRFEVTGPWPPYHFTRMAGQVGRG